METTDRDSELKALVEKALQKYQINTVSVAVDTTSGDIQATLSGEAVSWRQAVQAERIARRTLEGKGWIRSIVCRGELATKRAAPTGMSTYSGNGSSQWEKIYNNRPHNPD